MLISVHKPSAPLFKSILEACHLDVRIHAIAFARILKNNPSEVIHFIFDIYLDSSLKSGER